MNVSKEHCLQKYGDIKDSNSPAAGWSAWWESALWWQRLCLADKQRCWECSDPPCWYIARTDHTLSQPRCCVLKPLCQPPTPWQTRAGTFGPVLHSAGPIYLKHSHKQTLRLMARSEESELNLEDAHASPKVMTPWALTLVGSQFALNWERGSEAGSSVWHSVKDGIRQTG